MKKRTSLCLSILMMIGMLTGSIGFAEGTAVDFSEHETFTVWLQADTYDYYADYSENPIVQFLNNKFNVTLEYQQPPAGTEQDAIALMFGTGEYTDMVDMSYYTGSIEELYQDDIIVDIAEYLDYMPNLKKLLESDDGYRRSFYDDDGKILTLKTINTSDELTWGGLVYRRDILETMTGGAIEFPSGNDQPTTIEDWDYMLPLFEAYFQEAGMTDYATLILPYNGMFGYSEIINGFGASNTYFIDGKEVKYGPMEDGFYNYLVKMKEWFDAGYIYKDFASRTNDPFFLPNTALTYGGSAGVWYGLNSQLGDAMSMPEYGLIFDVQPIPSPIDTEHGITAAAPFSTVKYNITDNKGSAVTTVCKDIPKLLSIMDFMYSDEGAMMYIGLTKEQGADTDSIYAKADLQDGAYWFEGDQIVYNPLFSKAGGTMNHEPFMSNRLPCLRNNTYDVEFAAKEFINANTIWGMYGEETTHYKLPGAISRPAEEDVLFTQNNTQLLDYVQTSVPKFIIGTTELSEETWEAYKAQLVAYGIEENLRIQQEAYDRYLNR